MEKEDRSQKTKSMNSVAIFGASKIGQRRWRPGNKVWSIAIFGASEIDFRQAELQMGDTEVAAFSLFGANRIVVPHGLPVTLSGFSILGAREVKQSKSPETTSTPGKNLRVNAISIMGACEITEPSEDRK